MYTFSFLSALLTLVCWFFFKKEEGLSSLFSKLFFASLLAYGSSVLLADATVGYKLSSAFRDFMVLGVSALLVNTFGINKQLFIGLAAGIGMVMSLFFLPMLEQTFPEKKTKKNAVLTETAINNQTSESTIPLDKNGELFVEIKENHQFSELKNLLDKYDLTYTKAFKMEDENSTDLDDYFVVNVPDNSSFKLADIEADFYASGLVDWVEENEQVSVAPIESRTPTPTERKYGINDPDVKQLWGFKAMEVDKLYALLSSQKVKPTKKALIAILDTGVDSKHEDLADNYLSTSDLYDLDMRGHGTHCAGIAAAVTNNKIGGASFSPNSDFVEVTSIKVLMDSGFGTQQTIINGMLEAADKGAAVISMSLGGRSRSGKQNAYSKAVKYAAKKGTIVIAAAGNSNTNAKQFSPANAPGVISVSAIDTVLNRASFSNYISDLTMGIAAPGVAIYSTYPNNEYKVFNGTSMATPYVSGLVGLMKSIQPKLTTQEVYTILKETGKETKNTAQTGRLIFPVEAIKQVLK
jgi:thermitase